MNTIAICDTEPIAIQGLRSLLESADSLRIVAAETSLTGAMAATRQLHPSILIVDKAFGYRALSDWLADLRHSSAPLAVVIWGESFAEVEAMRFVQAGAAGILSKTASLETVLECLHTVERGNTWMAGDILRERRVPRTPRSALTHRELQVMDLVERGKRNKDIACALGIQVGTVKIHLRHISEKTGVRGRYGLALNGLKEKGLLTAV